MSDISRIVGQFLNGHPGWAATCYWTLGVICGVAAAGLLR